MVITLLIWLYMLVISYILGVSLLNIVCRDSLDGIKHETTYVWAGISILIVYAQIWSLFGKVGLWANLILIVSCALIVIIQYRRMLSKLREILIWTKPSRFMVIGILIILFAYGTSHGIMHYDSDLYHAQSIRWIEEYGVVPGLGNIHSRLAYNSSSFALTALFSMSFLGGQSYHVCTGFMALLVAINCIDLFKKDEILEPKLSNMVRIVAIYYLLMIFDEMVAPASDYFMVLLTIELVLSYTELMERRIESLKIDTSLFALLSLLGLVILTVKISGAVVVLVAAYPVYLYLKEKDIRSILKYVLMGIVVVLPFIIRNVILSGYLVYPFPSIDIFNFDFKIPKGMAEYDAKEIQVWGRGYSDVLRFDEPMSKWLPDWFGNLDIIDKAAFLLAVTGLLVVAALIIYYLVKKAYFVFPQLLIVMVIDASFVFWLMTSPNLRYGCIFLYLAPVLTWGYVYSRLGIRIDRGMVFKIAMILFLLYKGGMFVNETAHDFLRIKDSGNLATYAMRQQDYGKYDVIAYDIRTGEDVDGDGEYVFYHPALGDQIGYEAFPGTVVKPDVKLRGDDIGEGFVSK